MRRSLLLPPLFVLAACDPVDHTEELAQIEVSAQSIDFGEVLVGEEVRRRLTIENTGTFRLDIYSISPLDEQLGFLVSHPFASIAVGEQVEITLVFQPGGVGEVMTYLLISSNAASSANLRVELKGTGYERTPDNSRPSAPVIAIEPAEPRTDDELRVRIVTPSVDPDGDAVIYLYQWARNGMVQAGLDAESVPAAMTAKGEMWRVTVTASDGIFGGPQRSTQVTIANSAPGAAVVHIEPVSPGDGDDLTCTIDTDAIDADGDAVTHRYSWTRNATPAAHEGAMVPAAETQGGDTWSCSVIANDGTDDGVPATATATISRGGS